MDGTPYSPPAPTVQPPAAPEPQYTQAPYAPAESPKKKTGLIIGIVVGVLLLCCCGSTVAGLLLFRSSGGTTEEPSTDVVQQTEDGEDQAPESTPESGNPEGPAEGTGWEDFAPAAYDPGVWTTLQPFHEEVLAEAATLLFPEFEIAERVVRPSTEYSTDTILASATLASDPEVSIAFWLEAENTPAFESGWVWDPVRDGYDYMEVATAANGREYSWDITELVPLLKGMGDSKTRALLLAVADDFPGAVITAVEIDGDSASVGFTRWDAYPDYDEGFSADYSHDGTGWILDSAEQW